MMTEMTVATPIQALTKKDFESGLDVRWCPGCGDYAVLSQITKLMPKLGIPRENLKRLFEPFFTTKKNGTGLGLAISKRIALEHQGAIEVRSETGKGSIFTILLPAI